ncbi:MAG: UvrD-helicase domain-containing protein [Alphaproteobacteria bacterium]|nr:UvrD-helicase domain-containing protein [Alphaproteobacteria bacterium]
MNNTFKKSSDALDINASCFAFASAGSGKTKLLVDRYVKSLISGIKPSEILCITFTNFAVSEMFNRISSILKDLHTKDNEYIYNYLSNTLSITNVNSNLIRNVRKLFIMFQNELNHTKIMTLHSFCRTILTQFAIEADISPGFNIIEQEELKLLLHKAKQRYFNSLIDCDTNIPFSSYYLNELIDDIFSNNTSYLSIYNQNAKNILYNKLIVNNIQFNTEQQYIINTYFDNQNVEDVFLTKTGSIRKNIKCTCVNTSILNDIAQTVYEMKINNDKANILSKTKIFTQIINGIYNELSLLKSTNNILDFNDIINKTYYLLKYSSYKDYVLLEVAKNIKTILLDEAQDLSTIQWAIIGFFIENCFADILNNKSIFIVGDIKQSIYRFQNANYKAFIDFYKYSKKATKQFNKKLYTVYLDKCYRTLPNILNNIDKIFTSYSQFAFNNEYRKHIPVRNYTDNIVQLSIDCIKHKQNPSIKNNIEIENVSNNDGVFELINTNDYQSIAQYIYDNNIRDALILFRSRNDFNTALYYELIKLGLNVAPLDKLCLNDIKIVQTILSMANIAIDSANDKCLALILQSSYVFDNPINNQELFDLCYNRNQQLIDCIKIKYNNKFEVIHNIITTYKSTNLLEFFYYIIYKVIKINNINDNDVIATFMDIVISYSENYNENIIDFLDYFNNTEHTMHSYDNFRDCIRFSSIHSSKGLEANNVILLNFNLQSDKGQVKFIYKDNQNIFEPYNNKYLFFIKPSVNESCIELEEYINEEYTEESKELFRLLYVALTRARDKLYVFNNGSDDNDNTAFGIIKKSLCNEDNIIIPY